MSPPPRNPHRPAIRLLVASGLVTIAAILVLAGMRIDGDIYGLLGRDDPAVMRFHALAEVTPGLEELLVVCPPGDILPQGLVEAMVTHGDITEHTRTYFSAGKSTVQGFSLSVDPSDWRDTRPVIEHTTTLLHGTDCGLTGTPAVVYGMQSLLNTDLKLALTIAAILVSLIFAFAYRIGWLAVFMLVPVAAGITWGLAAYALLRGEFTLLAATIPTLLIGIGIDHCIHLIQSCRYSMANNGLRRTDAVQQMGG